MEEVRPQWPPASLSAPPRQVDCQRPEPAFPCYSTWLRCFWSLCAAACPWAGTGEEQPLSHQELALPKTNCHALVLPSPELPSPRWTGKLGNNCGGAWHLCGLCVFSLRQRKPMRGGGNPGKVPVCRRRRRNEAQPGSCPEFRARTWVPGARAEDHKEDRWRDLRDTEANGARGKGLRAASLSGSCEEGGGRPTRLLRSSKSEISRSEEMAMGRTILGAMQKTCPGSGLKQGSLWGDTYEGTK
eukprot:XP_017173812.1 PREDICTED: uncharacterized protein Gm36787 [Mus musculus]